MPTVDVLIPTYRRKTALAVTLASVFAQSFRDLRVTIADQTPAEERYTDDPELRTIVGALRFRGIPVRIHARGERRGLAEQRDFLLRQAEAPYVWCLDDDVLVEPDQLARMLAVLQAESCGFVGAAAAGVGWLDDERPHQQRRFEPWEGPVTPEPFAPDAVPRERHHVNSAANPLHLERRLVREGETIRYKIAWVGGANVLYDRVKLVAVGGFGFWRDLPPEHAGEEVVAQWLLVRRFGGCGVLPCGTYHLGLPTTVEDRTVDATSLFGSLLAATENPPARRTG